MFRLRIVSALLLFATALSAQTLHPKLIVVISVDQMRADYLDRFAAYEQGGFHTFAAAGADFINANYDHTPTETGPGHSIMMSGRNPEHTGIVSNTWYDRSTGKSVYCVADANSSLVGDTGSGASAANFIGESFGDQFQRAFRGARVFSASLKDRAAVLMAGKHPTEVFWYSTRNGTFISSTYYTSALQGWVTEFDSSKPGDAYAGKSWELLLPADSPAYAGHTQAFPHRLPDTAGHQLYNAVFDSPYGDELLERFVEAMVAANNVGGQQAPDLLTVSFSSNDSIGHGYGPDSAEIADEQIRLDGTLGKLMQFINGRVGQGKVLWALTADHGSEPTPEAERELRHNQAARRVSMQSIQRQVEQQLDKIFHQPDDFKWFAAVTDPGFYFDRKNLEQHHVDLAQAREAMAKMKADGIAEFYDMSKVRNLHGHWGTLLRNSYYAPRSGDVYYRADEWVLISDQPTGTSHSNPFRYDTHVPFAIAGNGIAAQRISAPVHVTDLAPTLASLIGMRWQTDEKESQSRARMIQRVQAAAAR
jgi:hypothetical protein